MSAVDNSKTPAQSGFFAKHEVNFYTAAAVGSLALALLSLGVIIAAMGTSPQWYYEYSGSSNTLNYARLTECGEGGVAWNGPDIHSLPQGTLNAGDIQSTMQYGAKVGGVALGPCIAGFVLFALALYARYKAMQRKNEGVIEQPKDPSRVAMEATAQRWKYIGILLGVSIGAFSTGLMIGSSTILNNGVSHFEDLINQGRVADPNLRLYHFEYYTQLEGRELIHYVRWDNSGDPLWDTLQKEWLDSTKSAMSGMVPVGLFGALGGAGLCGAAIFGKGVFSCVTCIKDRCTKEDENEQAPGGPEL